jgi:predicted extracellular nuclease
MADGAFVQSLQADADAASAEGLFVMPAEGQPALEVGQHVFAEGLVAESGDGATLTTLADARIDVRGTTALPEPVVLAAPPADWEAFEGMRLRIEAPLTVTGNDALLRFGEIDLAFDGRLYTPTEIAAPGDAAIALRADNRRRLLVLDDASSAQNPGDIAWLSAPLSGDAPLRAGSKLVGVQGVLDQRWGGYRLQADAVVGEIEQAPRPAAPSVEGAIRIAGMNLLNLFNGDGQRGGFPTERGAKDHDGYARQMAKHVTVITALDPAIIAAQELENDGFGPESAVQELADELNAAQPGARWTPVAPEGKDRVGTDQITVGILYRADRVEAVGAPALKADGPFEHGSRPVLAQSFRMGDSPVFTVASVHFKSKGGCEDAQGADRDQGDGQACFNAKRVESAEAMHAWLATDPTGSGSDRVAAIGDYNAYAMEEPMQWLRDNGWQDAFARTDGAPQHSFVFDGQAGRLDHAMLSPSMAAMLRGAAQWPVNSDESIGFAYDGVLGRGEANEWRSSDHDPLLLGFDNTSAR